jgi:hypothetical protein
MVAPRWTGMSRRGYQTLPEPVQGLTRPLNHPFGSRINDGVAARNFFFNLRQLLIALNHGLKGVCEAIVGEFPQRPAGMCRESWPWGGTWGRSRYHPRLQWIDRSWSIGDESDPQRICVDVMREKWSLPECWCPLLGTTGGIRNTGESTHEFRDQGRHRSRCCRI